MFDGVPWMIGGGEAVHNAESGRGMAFMASNGATGIILPTDLRVTDLDTPGTAVQIAPGGAAILNTYPGAPAQSYTVRNPEATQVPIPATDSSGGATRYLIVRIDDPQYNGGQFPADHANGPYVFPELVSSITGLTYPFLPLAKIVQPASTGTILQSMITDLREVANPRSKDVVYQRPQLTGDSGMVLTSRSAYPDGEWFPNTGGDLNTGAYYVDVPAWATRMQIRMEWLGVYYHINAGFGQMWVTYGPDAGASTPAYKTQAYAWDADSAAYTYRTNWIVAQEVSIPAEWRGTQIPFVGRANKTSPDDTAHNGTVELTATSGMTFHVRFLEVAD